MQGTANPRRPGPSISRCCVQSLETSPGPEPHSSAMRNAQPYMVTGLSLPRPEDRPCHRRFLPSHVTARPFAAGLCDLPLPAPALSVKARRHSPVTCRLLRQSRGPPAASPPADTKHTHIHSHAGVPPRHTAPPLATPADDRRARRSGGARRRHFLLRAAAGLVPARQADTISPAGSGAELDQKEGGPVTDTASG